MRWTVKRTRWGWSLFHDGELVASADDPTSFFGLVLSLGGGAG